MKYKKIFYPLTKNVLDNQDINSGIKILRSKKITMGSQTARFEKQFSKKIAVKSSIMVNSGSSANLLIFQCLINPLIKKLKPGDEVLISSICWSTSLWPILQSGLKAKFVDVNVDNLNIDLTDLKKKISKKTKALMLVHALGNCADMDKIVKICKQNKLILIEDTCEALGSTYKGKKLGTFGDFSSFSFYYSHHITSGEGGMVCTKSKKYLNVIKTLRSHGWAREIEKKSKNNWKFINSGFNLRPTDISASIGISQLKKLKQILNIRRNNYNLITRAFLSNSKFNNQFRIIKESAKTKICWFGIAIVLKSKKKNYKNSVTKKLNLKGIDTRPLISGNFANQPAVKLYKLKYTNNLINADFLDKNSFFLGIHNNKITKKEIRYLTRSIYSSL